MRTDACCLLLLLLPQLPPTSPPTCISAPTLAFPERALTAYLCFVKSKMSSVQKKNPELKQVQIMQELGRLWKHLPDHKRSTFEEQSKQDKERHAREMAAYTPGQAPSAGSTSPDTAAEPAEAVEAAAPTRKRKSSDVSDKSTKKHLQPY